MKYRTYTEYYHSWQHNNVSGTNETVALPL